MLTGGGDCPGLNAVLRAIVRKGQMVYGDELIGFHDGWRGVLEGVSEPLDIERMRGTLPRGGTIIGSSRTNPYKVDGGPEQVKATLAALGIDALVAIGGEDTLGVAAKLHDDGVAVVGVPKTIDNDLSATELTFGFDTAVQICVDGDRPAPHDRRVARSGDGRRGHGPPCRAHRTVVGHRRGATMVLLPEKPFVIDDVCAALRHRHEGTHHYASIVVVSEGAVPADAGTFLAHGSGEVDALGHARLGGIGGTRWRRRSRSAPASSAARPCSATSSAGTPDRA